ncbi:UNVERIFIED_CONTAM: hypothetical protein NY100_00055 [Prevotella sp. 15_C9]
MKKKKTSIVVIMLLLSVWMMPKKAMAETWEGHDLWTFTQGYFDYKGNTNVTNDNILYFQNVGAEDAADANKYLNTFGHWGVEGTLYSVGTPFFLNYIGISNSIQHALNFSILTSPDANKSTQNHLAWIYGQDAQRIDYNGLMSDRMDEDNERSGGITCKSRWVFWPVKGYTNDGDRRYWIAYKDAQNKWYYLRRNTTKKGLRQNIVEAANLTNAEAESSSDCHWRIVTRNDLIKKYDANAINQMKGYSDFIDATFYIWDQNFSRKDKTEWRWEKSENTKIGNNFVSEDGTEENPKYVIDHNDPVVNQLTSLPHGYETAYNSIFGMFFCAEIRGAEGYIQQETEPLGTGGYYMLSVQGFYSPASSDDQPRAYLFAETDNPDNPGQREVVKNPLPLVSSLPNSPTDLTEAGIRFYEDYENYSTKVIIKIKEGEKLRLGVKLENGSQDDWVAIDNFQLKYIGDEYLISQRFGNANNYWEEQKYKTLILERFFVIDKWNSFCMPLDLNKDQVTTTFGSNVKLAKLKGISDDGTTIEFESVNLNAMKWEDVAINKNEPYLILPHVEGRKYDIKWKDYFDNAGNPIITHGPNYVIPLTCFNKNDAHEQEKTFVNPTNGKKTTIHNLHFWRTSANTDYPCIKVSPDKYIYAMNKGNLRRMTKDFSIPGLTFYVEYEEAPSAQAKIGIVDKNGGNVPNDIIAIDNTATHNRLQRGVFNLNGQKVSSSNSIHGLRAGVYIVDGKKVMVY